MRKKITSSDLNPAINAPFRPPYSSQLRWRALWPLECGASSASPKLAFSVGSVAVLSLLAVPSLAVAQSAAFYDRGNNTGVLDRAKPDFQPLGINVGSFILSPSLSVTPEYDDNIFATDTDRTSDLVTVIRPAIRATSNWSRNQVSGFATVTSSVYADHGSEGTTDYAVGGSGRLDILSNDDVTAGLSYAHNTIARTGENTIADTVDPLQYDTVEFDLGSLQQLNRLRFSENFSFNRTGYDNTTDLTGAPIDLSYLNASTEIVGGRADYALNPELSLYLSGSFNNRSYDTVTSPLEFNRSSDGVEFTVGTSFDITRLIRGQASFGYLEQSYTSSLFKTVSGPAVHVNVEYFFSGLTTFGLSVNRAVIDAVDPTAVSLLQTQGVFTVDHELLRNVILSGRVSYETDSFTGIQRTDERTSVGATATYLMNRNWSFVGAYSFLNENSTGLSRISPYYVNLVSISIVYKL